MKKTIRIMAIIATVLAGFSLLLIFASIPLQSIIAREIYGCSEEILDAMPLFPTVAFLNCLFRMVCFALLIICCGNQKGGIWMELMIAGCLAIVLPVVAQISSWAYSMILGNMNSLYLAANSIVTSMVNFCLAPAGLGQTLAYVTCGMSIAYKRLGKKN